MLIDVLNFLVVVTIILSAIFLVRNLFVYRFYGKVLRNVSTMARAQITAGNYNEWQKFYNDLAKVDYFEMVFKFWRPLRSFYPAYILPKKGE